MFFVNCRHWGLRQRRFPPPVPTEAQQRRARTQTVRAAWRSISQKSRTFNPGTKGVPSISILVISREYHQLPRYRENSAQTLFKQSKPRVKTEESGPKRRDWLVICKQWISYGNSSMLCFSSVHTAEASTGPAMVCIWPVFHIQVWCILRRVFVLGTAKWTDFLCINVRVICCTVCIYHSM